MLVIKREESLNTIEKWKKEHLTIGFTSGVFDLLHLGHIRYLEAAKKNATGLSLQLMVINPLGGIREVNGLL